MLRRVILALACATLLTVLAAAPARAIVGGQLAPAGQWPWLVALVGTSAGDDFRGQFCGGAVIAPHRVLTAAHCVSDASPGDVDVLIGRTRLTGSGGRHIAVTGIHIDPAWTSGKTGLDAAVVTLAADAGVAPLPLARADQAAAWATGTPAWAMGWGALNGTNSPGGAIYYADRLRQVTEPIVSDDACENAYGGGNGDILYRPAWSVCAGTAAPGVGPCWGDSGGPLVVAGAGGWLEVGIVKGGDGCGSPGYYDIYTRADAVRAFALGHLRGARTTARAPSSRRSQRSRLHKSTGRLPAGNRRLFGEPRS